MDRPFNFDGLEQSDIKSTIWNGIKTALKGLTIPGQICKKLIDWLYDKIVNICGHLGETSLGRPVREFFTYVSEKFANVMEKLLSKRILDSFASVKQKVTESVWMAFAGVCLLITIIFICRVLGFSVPRIIDILARVFMFPIHAFDWLTGWVSEKLRPFSPDLDPALVDVQHGILNFEADTKVCETGLITAVSKAIVKFGETTVGQFLKDLRTTIVERSKDAYNFGYYSISELKGFLFLGKYGPPAIATTLNSMEPHHYAGMGPMEFLGGLIGTAFLGSWPSKNDTKSCLDFLRVFAGSIVLTKATLSFAELFVGYLPAAMEYWVRKTIYGKCEHDDAVPSLLIASRELCSMSLQARNNTTEYFENCEQLLGVMENALQDVSPPSRRSLLEEIGKLSTITQHHTNTNAIKRPVPVLVRFFGGAGVGKSTLIPKVMEDCVGSYFSPPAAGQHWTGANISNTTGLFFDEFGQLTRTLPDEVAEIIRLVSCTEYEPPMADTASSPGMTGASKGLKIAPKLVVLAGNLGQLGMVPGVANIQAFHRRQDFYIEVSVKTEFTVGGTGPDRGQLDPAKINFALDNGTISHEYLALFKHLVFTPMIVTNKDGKVIRNTVPISFAKLLEMIKVRITYRQKQYDEAVTQLQSLPNPIQQLKDRHPLLMRQHGPDDNTDSLRANLSSIIHRMGEGNDVSKFDLNLVNAVTDSYALQMYKDNKHRPDSKAMAIEMSLKHLEAKFSTGPDTQLGPIFDNTDIPGEDREDGEVLEKTSSSIPPCRGMSERKVRQYLIALTKGSEIKTPDDGLIQLLTDSGALAYYQTNVGKPNIQSLARVKLYDYVSSLTNKPVIVDTSDTETEGSYHDSEPEGFDTADLEYLRRQKRKPIPHDEFAQAQRRWLLDNFVMEDVLTSGNRGLYGYRLPKGHAVFPEIVAEQSDSFYEEETTSIVLDWLKWSLAGLALFKFLPKMETYMAIPAFLDRWIRSEVNPSNPPTLDPIGMKEHGLYPRGCTNGPSPAVLGNVMTYTQSTMPWKQTGPDRSTLDNLTRQIVKIDCECFVDIRFGFYNNDEIVSFAHGACLKGCVLHIERDNVQFTIDPSEYTSRTLTYLNDQWIIGLPPGRLGLVKRISNVKCSGVNKIEPGTSLIYKPHGEVFRPNWCMSEPSKVDITARDGSVARVPGIVVPFYTKVGDCGLPVFLQTPGLQLKYIGPLVAGNDGGKSLAVVYQPEKVDDEVWYTTGVSEEASEDDSTVDLNDIMHNKDVRDLSSQLKKERVSMSNLHTVNLTPVKPPNAPNKTKYKFSDIPRSTLFASFVADNGLDKTDELKREARMAPSCLTTRDPRTKDNTTHPAYYKLSKLAASRTTPPANLELAARYVKEELDAILPKTGGRILSREEAVSGIPGEILSMNLNTAVGAPLCYHDKAKARPGKSAFIKKYPDGSVLFDDALMERFAEYDAMRTGGDTVRQEIVGYLKDEILPWEKVVEKRTRIIFCCDAALLIELKSQTGWLTTYCADVWDRTKMVIGPDLRGSDMDKFIRMLYCWENPDFPDTKACCGDFKSFDLSMNDETLDAVYGIIGDLCQGRISGFDRGYYDMLIASMVSARFNVNGVAFSCRGFNPSGNYLTTIINCIYNRILFYSWILSKDLSPLTTIRHFPGGDDVAWSINPNYVGKYGLDPKNFAEYVGELGMTYTPALKNKSWDEAEHFVHPLDLEFYGLRPVPVLNRCATSLDDRDQFDVIPNWKEISFCGKFKFGPIWKGLAFRAKSTTLEEWAISSLESLAWTGIDFQERIRACLMYATAEKSVHNIAQMYNFMDLERRLFLNKDRYLVMNQHGDAPIAVASPAPVAVTAPATMVEMEETSIHSTDTAQPFSTVSTGQALLRVAASDKVVNNSGSSVTASAADQLAGLATWQFRGSFTVDGAFTQFEVKTPFQLLELGGTTTIRSQEMAFNSFAYCHGPTEIAFLVPGQKFYIGALIAVALPNPDNNLPAHEDINAMSMSRKCIMRLSRNHRYEMKLDFEYFRSVFSTVEGLEKGEDDANNWTIVIRGMDIPADQEKVVVQVFSRFPEMRFSIPRRVVAPERAEINALATSRNRLDSNKIISWSRMPLDSLVKMRDILMAGDEGVRTVTGRSGLYELVRKRLRESTGFMSEPMLDILAPVLQPKRRRAKRLVDDDNEVVESMVQHGGGHSRVSETNTITQNFFGTATDIETGATNSATSDLGASTSVEAELSATPMHHPTCGTLIVATEASVGPMTNTQGGLYAQPMSHGGVAEVRDEKVFTYDDETSFRSMMRRETIVARGQFNATDPVGTVFYSDKLGINRSRGTTGTGLGWLAEDAICDRLANLALKWRGDFIYTIYTLGNDFQKIPVLMAAAYGASAEPTFTEQYQQVNHQTVLSGDCPAVRVRVPYNAVTPTLYIDSNYIQENASDPILTTTFGFFTMALMGQMVTQPDYPVMPFFITKAFDGEFFHAIPRPFCGVTISQVTGVMEQRGPESRESSPEDQGGSDSNVFPVKEVEMICKTHDITGVTGSMKHRSCFEGQPFLSLNAMARRFTPAGPCDGLYRQDFNNGGGQLRSVSVYKFRLNYLTFFGLGDGKYSIDRFNLFAGYRGGLHIQIATDALSDFVVTWRPFRSEGSVTYSAMELAGLFAELDHSKTSSGSVTSKPFTDYTAGTNGAVRDRQMTWSADVSPVPGPSGPEFGGLGAYQRSAGGFLNIHIPWIDVNLFGHPLDSPLYGDLIVAVPRRTSAPAVVPSLYVAAARDFCMGRWTGKTKYPNVSSTDADSPY